jgi:hypothetical protein
MDIVVEFFTGAIIVSGSLLFIILIIENIRMERMKKK